MVLEEMVDVYICLEKLNEKLEIIHEDFDSIYISKVTRYNELMNKYRQNPYSKVGFTLAEDKVLTYITTNLRV